MVAEDFEILEEEVVEKEDMAADTEQDTVAGTEVVGTEAYPCRLTEAAENF